MASTPPKPDSQRQLLVDGVVTQPPASSPPSARSRWTRLLGALQPTHAHSIFSATVILMASTFLSRIIGLVRIKYIAWLFGRGMQADAFNAAFYLPDMISYFLVGGAASITFVTILTRYREEGREAEGERSLSVILTTMFLVLGAATRARRDLRSLVVHWWFTVSTRKRLRSACISRAFCCPRSCVSSRAASLARCCWCASSSASRPLSPLIYGLGTIVGGLLLVKRIGVSSLALGTVAGAILGPFLLNWLFAHRAGTRYRFILDWRDAGLREWVRLSLPLMAGVSLVTADNWIIGHFASRTGGAVALMSYAKQLFSAPMSMLAQAAGAASMPFFASLWTRDRHYEFATGVADSVSRVASLGLAGRLGHGGAGLARHRPGLYRRALLRRRRARVQPLLRHLLRLHVPLGGAGHLRARLLRRRKHFCAHGRQHHRHRRLAAHL